MKVDELAPISEEIKEMEHLYGKFSLGIDGCPSVPWQRRNLRFMRLDWPLQLAFFPEAWVHRIWVNHRMVGPLGRVLAEINARWTPEAKAAYGLDQFVKCYCFGEGAAPSLFWYGAAWQLSEQVGGEVLSEVVKVFTRNGFTHGGATDKKRIRTFEYW